MEKLITSVYEDAGVLCDGCVALSLKLSAKENTRNNVPLSPSFQPSVGGETFWRLMFVCHDTLLVQRSSVKFS